MHVVIDLVAELRQRIQSVAAAPTAACSQSRLVATASCLQHVDEEQLLYTFCRPAGGAMECGFQEGEMLLLSVEGAVGGRYHKPAWRRLRASSAPSCAPPDASNGSSSSSCIVSLPAPSCPCHVPVCAGQHVAVARGHFYTCTATHVTISLNRAMRRGLLKPSGGGAPADACAAAGGSGVLFDASIKWRLDRDDGSSTFVRLRGNLFALFR